MSHAYRSLIAFICLATLASCGQKPEAPRAAATDRPASTSPTQGQAKPPRPAQEVAFIRECLAVGLRPTILLELESKALAEAQGQAKASGPTKAQLKDLRDSFSAAAARLNEMAASPAAGRKAPLAQLLADTRAKQAANCSRLPDDWLHREGAVLILADLFKITAQTPNQQEKDRRADEYAKQNWPNLFNLPVQQKAALDEILKTEQEFQQVVIGLNEDPELKVIQREAITEVVSGLEARAKKTASLMTPVRFYETLIGHQFRPNAGRLEAGEMVKLVILEQRFVGHCIVSSIRLDLRGNRSGQTASLKLNVVHRTYANGQPALLQVIEN